jgi:hypothetical protein
MSEIETAITNNAALVGSSQPAFSQGVIPDPPPAPFAYLQNDHSNTAGIPPVIILIVTLLNTVFFCRKMNFHLIRQLMRSVKKF